MAKITVWSQTLYCCNQFYNVDVPKNAKILSVIEQYGELKLYYEHAGDTPESDYYEFYALGTGRFQVLDGFTYLNTVSALGGKEVYHVYYRKKSDHSES